MNKIKILIGLLCILILGDIAAYYWLQPKLPIAILEAMHSNPMRHYANITLVVTLALLATAFIRLWQRKTYARLIYIIAIITSLISTLLFGTHAVYQWISFFDDLIGILLGVLLGLIFSHPYNHLFHQSASKKIQVNLAQINNLRLICFMTLTFLLLTFLAGHYTDSSMPKIFLDYLNSQPSNIYLDLISTMYLILNFFALVLLLFRLRSAKYLLILSILMLVIGEAFSGDALTGLDAMTGFIYIILNGMILGIVFQKSMPVRALKHNEYQ